MSASERLSNLTLPTEIGNQERFLSHRPKIIEERQIKCYAEEIVSVINQLVVENCNGCIIDHPSQRQHPCLMMESDERLSMYFDDALSKISEARVMENFMNSLNDMKPRVNGLELLKYTCYDWRSVFCANERRLLKNKTLEQL